MKHITPFLTDPPLVLQRAPDINRGKFSNPSCVVLKLWWIINVFQQPQLWGARHFKKLCTRFPRMFANNSWWFSGVWGFLGIPWWFLMISNDLWGFFEFKIMSLLMPYQENYACFPLGKSEHLCAYAERLVITYQPIICLCLRHLNMNKKRWNELNLDFCYCAKRWNHFIVRTRIKAS